MTVGRPSTAVEIPELWRRVAVTVGALAIYRLGRHIPLPGVDLALLNQIFGAPHGVVDNFGEPAFRRLSIFALGIGPYVSASLCVLLLTAGSRLLRARSARHRDLDWLARVGAVLLAAVGGYAIAVGLESSGSGATAVVPEPGASFHFLTMATLVAGTVFLMWLADEITRRGIGNGVAMILFTDIVASLPRNFAALIEMGRKGELVSQLLVPSLALLVAAVALIVLMERAQRRLLVQYRPRLIGAMMFEGEGAYLGFKLNNFGIIPVSAASSLLLLPTALGLAGMGRGGWPAEMAGYLRHGAPAYLVSYGGLIVVGAFLYTALLFSPKGMADRLQAYGGAIAGREPGKDTADYLDHVLTRLTLVGGVYVAGICLLPDILASQYRMPFYFGGTNLLVLVCVALDLLAQIRAHADAPARAS